MLYKKKKETKDSDRLILLRVWMPLLLKNEFKSKCARRGRSVTEVIIDMMKSYIEFRE